MVTGLVKTDRDRFVALAFCWADMVLETDADKTIVFAAGPTEKIFGRTPGKLVGAPLSQLVDADDWDGLCRLFDDADESRIEGHRIRMRQGNADMLMLLSGFRQDEHLFLGLKRIPTRQTSPFAPALDHDEFAETAARRAIEMGQDNEASELTMVSIPKMADPDAIVPGEIRERLHRAVTDTLKRHSVGGDCVTDLGQGRFSLLRSKSTSLAEMISAAETLISQFASIAYPSWRGRRAKVHAQSVGLDGAEMINQRDLAKGLLYAMNKFRSAREAEFDLDSLNTNIAGLVETAVRDLTEFKALLTRSLYDVALQPIVDAKRGSIHHYEALCRFRVEGATSPYAYISFAEETGMIAEFDLAMTTKVIEWLRRTSPINASRPLRVAVNVSGRSVTTPGYVEGLTRLLRDNSWTRGRLLFEITESARMTDLVAAGRFVEGLRRAGYHVCLDDFGSGAASFQYLSSLEVDIVKFDGSAIRNAEKAHKGAAFLGALTDLCRRLGVKTVAEMVDTPERFAFCRDCGCDYIQGYLFGKPDFDIKAFQPLPAAHLFHTGKAKQ